MREGMDQGGARGRGVMRRLVLPLVSGVMLGLASPGIGWYAGVWLGLVPLLVALWGRPDEPELRIGQAFWRGWLTGFVSFLISLRWLREVWGAGPVLSVLGWGALSGYLACFVGLWAVFAAGAGRPGAVAYSTEHGMWRPAGWSLALAAANAGCWAGLEWVRGWMLTGFSWNGLGVAMATHPPLVQVAEFTGAAGLSFFPVFASSVMVVAGGRMVRRARVGGGSVVNVDLLAVLAMVALLVVFGLERLARHAPQPERGRMVHCVVIQPNTSQDIKWDPSLALDHAEETVVILREALEARDARRANGWLEALEQEGEVAVEIDPLDLVVLPESALAFFRHDSETAETVLRLQELAGPRATVITGVNDLEPGENPVWYNTISLFAPGGEESSVYRKIGLVPFGEYLPLRWFPPMRWLAGNAIPGDFAPGDSTEPLVAGEGADAFELIPLICFEDTVGRLARRFVRSGTPQVIVNATNDGWFDDPVAARQHAANALLRCIELRRPMIRSANTGVSLIADARGLAVHPVDGSPQELLDEAGGHQVRGALIGVAWLDEDQPVTFYARFGDVFSAVALFGALGFGGWRLRRGQWG